MVWGLVPLGAGVSDLWVQGFRETRVGGLGPLAVGA